MLGDTVNAYRAYEKISTSNNMTVPMYIILKMPEFYNFFRTNLEIVTTNYVHLAVHITHVVDERHAKT
jgi:hypothetical protein